mgnify:CR=1 FL=1
MKRVILILAIIVGVSLVVTANETMKPKKAMKNFRAVPVKDAEILQKGKAKMFCNVCGMTLPMFYKTNHVGTINNEQHQYCSIHCLEEDALTKGKKATNVKVVDNSTLKFIESKSAFYVVGSKKPATMSMVSKYAFGTQEDANKFANKFGGEVMKYNELEKIVKNSMQKEISMITKRQAKAAKMGEKIYHKMCKETDERFQTAGEAKAFIKDKKLCGKLKGKPFQQVGLYLAGK